MAYESTDWKGYRAQATHRHMRRYLRYAEAHKQLVATDYDALEGEHTNILLALNAAHRNQRLLKKYR